jgi:hypothetical protein
VAGAWRPEAVTRKGDPWPAVGTASRREVGEGICRWARVLGGRAGLAARPGWDLGVGLGFLRQERILNPRHSGLPVDLSKLHGFFAKL